MAACGRIDGMWMPWRHVDALAIRMPWRHVAACGCRGGMWMSPRRHVDALEACGCGEGACWCREASGTRGVTKCISAALASSRRLREARRPTNRLRSLHARFIEQQNVLCWNTIPLVSQQNRRPAAPTGPSGFFATQSPPCFSWRDSQPVLKHDPLRSRIDVQQRWREADRAFGVLRKTESTVLLHHGEIRSVPSPRRWSAGSTNSTTSRGEEPQPQVRPHNAASCPAEQELLKR